MRVARGIRADKDRIRKQSNQSRSKNSWAISVIFRRRIEPQADAGPIITEGESKRPEKKSFTNQMYVIEVASQEHLSTQDH